MALILELCCTLNTDIEISQEVPVMENLLCINKILGNEILYALRKCMHSKVEQSSLCNSQKDNC